MNYSFHFHSVNKVKELNNDGIATPHPNKGGTKKRNSSEYDVMQYSGRKKRAKQGGVAMAASGSTPQIAMAEEVNGLLRQMCAQKNTFLESLQGMTAAVEKLKVCDIYMICCCLMYGGGL